MIKLTLRPSKIYNIVINLKSLFNQMMLRNLMARREREKTSAFDLLGSRVNPEEPPLSRLSKC